MFGIVVTIKSEYFANSINRLVLKMHKVFVCWEEGIGFLYII
jgi:hypothetical protein